MMLATNLIAYLYTTAAYNSAALQLMVGQANLAVKQMHLPEPVPIVVQGDAKHYEVGSPVRGLGGWINTTNFRFEFIKGRLTHVSKLNWLESISPPVSDDSQLTNRVSLIDTNGAYQLATQWLSGLSVDVPALQKKFFPRTTQDTIYQQRTNQYGKPEVKHIPIPVFEVSWGNRPGFALGMNAAYVKIYGPTRELITFGLRGDMVKQIPFTKPPLEVTNAAELIGALPSPDFYVKQLFGGDDAYETVKSPDYVEAWLLNTDPYENIDRKPTIRAGPKKIISGRAKAFSNVLLDFDSYAWTEMKLCSPDFGLGLRFVRGNDKVEFLFCYNCDILEVAHNGHRQQENFDFAHNRLVWAAQDAFPWDGALGKLEISDEESARKEYEANVKQ